MRRVATALMMVGLLAGPRTPARADPSGGGGFCSVDPGLCAGLQDIGLAPEDRDDTAPARRRQPSRYYWRHFELTDGPFCLGPDGRQFFLRLIDRVTNQVIDERFTCPDPITVRSQALPPVPPPPSAVWDQVPLPAPEVRVNPGGGGLTGLETYFWYDQPATASLTLNLDGFAVTLDARAVRFRWRTGDGAEFTSTTAGTAAEPAARHVYEGKGSYTVSVDVVWSGTYTFAGPGFAPITVPLGERTFSGQAAYQVAEIRGVRQ